MINFLRRLKPSRRWLQFRLRSLLILTALVGLGIGGWQWWTWYQERAKYFQMLAVEDPVKRTKAIISIGEMGPRAKAAVPALIEALDDEELVDWDTAHSSRQGGSHFDIPVCFEAIRALGKIGPAAKPALPALVVKIEKSLAASDDLAAFKKRKRKDGAVPFSSDDYLAIAEASIDALEKIGPGKDAIPVLLKSLEYEQLAYIASDVLVKIGRPAIGPLVETFDDKNSSLDFEAASTLKKMGEEGIEAIASAIRDGKLSPQTGIEVLAVNACYPPVEVAILWKLARTEREPLRGVALAALGDAFDEGGRGLELSMDGGTSQFKKWKQRIPSTLEAARDDDLTIRVAAIELLAKGGRFAREVIPTLLSALDDKEIAVRQKAAHAISRIGCDRDQGAASVLARKLNDPDEVVRRHVAQAVCNLLQESKVPLPVLRTALRSENLEVSLYASLARWSQLDNTVEEFRFDWDPGRGGDRQPVFGFSALATRR